MDDTLRYKVRRCATLLAESPLDDEIKSALLDGLEKLTEEDLELLLGSLEREKLELARIERTVETFEKDQDKRWNALEKVQEEKARDIVKKFFEDLDKKIKEDLKKTLGEK